MRLLTLYLRSRQVPRALPAAVAGTAVVALLGNSPDHPVRTVTFVVLALALGLGVLGLGLGGPSAAVESTGAIPWPGWRSAHTVAIAVAVTVAALATTAAPAAIVLRDGAGLTGLTALAAATFGNQLAWTLPVAWAGAAAVIPPVSEPAVLAVLTWPMQPQDSVVAALVAAALAVAGLSAYAARGGRS